LAENRPKREPK